MQQSNNAYQNIHMYLHVYPALQAYKWVTLRAVLEFVIGKPKAPF